MNIVIDADPNNLVWYEFTKKGIKWCKGHELDEEFQETKFLIVGTRDRRLLSLGFYINDGNIVLGAGGALYGSDLIDFLPTDSFYKKCSEPTWFSKIGNVIYADETAAQPIEFEVPEFLDALKMVFPGKTVREYVPQKSNLLVTL